MAEAVRQSQAPIFFFQAENDYSLRAYSTAGRYPAFGSSRDDGHSLAWRGNAVWAADVFRFLNANCRQASLAHQ
jgi:hypothetical protein